LRISYIGGFGFHRRYCRCGLLQVNDSCWMLGDALCDAWVAFDVMCCTASILNLTSISVDRSERQSGRSTPTSTRPKQCFQPRGRLPNDGRSKVLRPTRHKIGDFGDESSRGQSCTVAGGKLDRRCNETVDTLQLTSSVAMGGHRESRAPQPQSDRIMGIAVI